MTLLPLASSPPADRSATLAALAAVPAPRPATDTLPLPLRSVFDASAAAERVLTAIGPDDRDAIVWLSWHIAALDHVLYPAAARHLPALSGALRSQQARTRALSLTLRRLHAQLAGDGAVSAHDVPSLRRQVLTALREHSAGERALIAQLQSALTGEQWGDLAGQYADRLQRGPTRPHPHTLRTGVLGRLAHRVSAVVDRTLDVLDSRAVRPVPIAPGAAAA